MGAETLSPLRFALPEDIEGIILKGRKHVHDLTGRKMSDDAFIALAASFYRTYWMVTRRIRQKEEELHRPLLFAAIAAATAVCEIARQNPQPPDEAVFARLFGGQIRMDVAMDLDKKVLADGAREFYTRLSRRQLGNRLADCLRLTMTENECKNKKAILTALKGMFSAVTNENTARTPAPDERQLQRAASVPLCAYLS